MVHDNDNDNHYYYFYQRNHLHNQSNNSNNRNNMDITNTPMRKRQRRRRRTNHLPSSFLVPCLLSTTILLLVGTTLFLPQSQPQETSQHPSFFLLPGVGAQPPKASSSTTTTLFPTTTTTTTSRRSPSSSQPPPPSNNGPIDEAMVTCNMEDLEQANELQLYTILHDLKQTAFFRTFRVDLSHTCPLRSWRVAGGGDDDNNHHHNNHGNNDDTEDDEFECPSAKFTEFELDDDAEPLCTVQPDQENDHDNDSDNPNGFSSNGSVDPPGFLSSNALLTLTKDGFQSKEQKQTYTWEQHVDKVVTPSSSSSSSSISSSSSSDCKTNKKKKGEETVSAAKVPDTTTTTTTDSKDTSTTTTTTNTNKNADCDDDALPNLLPNDFWLDLCTRVRNDDPTVVNLNLNPERNTGYNGTHIWTAIYEENCRAVSVVHHDDNHDTDNDTDDDVCLEERVLYRLLSGLHASTTLSIAKNYYPPSVRKNRTQWEPNPTYFMQKFGHHPDYVRNLHFSYVVLLRALAKAAPVLYQYDIRTGDVVEDETAIVLLRRLLDSTILKSCSSVFSAFDESLLFATTETTADFALQHNFKDVFLNISSILDCVQCQQCKLHGKLAMLGYGTALKILFTPSSQSSNPVNNHNNKNNNKNNVVDHLQLSRNEIVALINTLAKFSESIYHVRELTHLYLQLEQQQDQHQQSEQQQVGLSSSSPATKTTTSYGPSSPPVVQATFPGMDPTSTNNNNNVFSVATLDLAVGTIAALARQGYISLEQERAYLQMALQHKNPELLILIRHYSNDLSQLAQLLPYLVSAVSSTSTYEQDDHRPDAIVVGSGLAGMAAALTILDRGGKVIILEKEHLLGGNSNKASSGINACCPDNRTTTTTTEYYVDQNDDSLDLFRNDTTRSAGTLARPDLIQVLVENSATAVTWLRQRVGVDLSLKAQLGGHSARRTHRPSNGMAGAEIIYGMSKAIKQYQASGKVQILTDAKVTALLQKEEDETTNNSNGSDSGNTGPRPVIGVEYINLREAETQNETASSTGGTKLYADHIILATGGFAADRSAGSYLSQYRPELLQMPTTAGAFSTGDGITLATALGAHRVDMDKVQVHPTGWVDPAEPNKTSKVLAAELMRGVGGILLNKETGQRFCNELGTRAYVTDQMLAQSHPEYAVTKQWNLENPIPTFALVLSSSAAADGKKHVDLYTHKGLLTELQGVAALAKWMELDKTVLVETLQRYQAAAEAGKDKFGKTTFRGMPNLHDLDQEIFYAGTVTPVLHYCMGGITIDTQGQVLTAEGQIIPGLHAAGEVTGGVHGANRLAGNSLLECTVYGTVVGQSIPLRQSQWLSSWSNNKATETPPQQQQQEQQQQERVIAPSELAQHNTPDDCWVAIYGVVYDLTSFAQEHPAGPESIHVLAGQDGSKAFAAVHNRGLLEEVQEDIVGILGEEEDYDDDDKKKNSSENDHSVPNNDQESASKSAQVSSSSSFAEELKEPTSLKETQKQPPPLPQDKQEEEQQQQDCVQQDKQQQRDEEAISGGDEIANTKNNQTKGIFSMIGWKR